MYARYVRSIDRYVNSVDIDCHCWNAGPIDCGEKGLYAIDCWNWDDVCEFEKNAKFVATDAESVANVDVDSTNDCYW